MGCVDGARCARAPTEACAVVGLFDCMGGGRYRTHVYIRASLHGSMRTHAFMGLLITKGTAHLELVSAPESARKAGSQNTGAHLENAGAHVELGRDGEDLVLLDLEGEMGLVVGEAVVRVVRAHPAGLVQRHRAVPHISEAA